MLNLLFPAAMFGLALLAIPIIIHLFKPRRVRQTPFSSLRWLHLSEQRLSRRIKWHQILLFLVRAAFVTLLVLALAKPMFAPHGSATLAERFIILDVSRSMGYEPAKKASPMQTAKQIASDLIARGVAGDRTTVLLTGQSTRALGPLVNDAGRYLAPLRAALPLHSDTNLSSALQAIRPMLRERRPGTNVELYFITDNHQQSWVQGEIAAFQRGLDMPVNVHLIDVSAGAPQNAWIASARLIERTSPARRIVRVSVGCIGDAGQERTIRLTSLPGMPDVNRNLRLDPARLTNADIEIPPSIDLSGKVAQIVLEPSDALPDDDRFFLNLDSRGGLRVLVVEGDSVQPESLRPGVHLRTALNALAAGGQGSIELISRTASAVAATDLRDADAVFLVDVPELADANVSALLDRVRAGAGLAIFLGPSARPAFYNGKLLNPQDPSHSLMPAMLRSVAEADPRRAGLAPFTDIHWNHPLLAPLFDPVLGDLAQTRARSYYLMDAPLPSAQVLATVDQRAPGLTEHAVGAGKVLLFNTTANDQWSDLARRKTFVPLVDRTLAHLTGGSVRRMFDAGQTISLAIPEQKPNEKITVVSPT
ncbi:MAG: BatA and WFA domain-containing protein, partial [Planctomycetota bacterium]|nr:BatA and WFA domain-containing protein [Planctomycetota bacterium]